MWLSLTIILFGLWLLLAPFVEMDIASIKVNNALIGAIISTIGLYSINRKSCLRWLAVIAGIWMLFVGATPWFTEGNPYIWNNILSGLLITICGLALIDRKQIMKVSFKKN